MERLIKFLKDEEGVTAIEYGLIAALVGVAAIAALTTLGGNLRTLFHTSRHCRGLLGPKRVHLPSSRWTSPESKSRLPGRMERREKRRNGKISQVLEG